MKKLVIGTVAVIALCVSAAAQPQSRPHGSKPQAPALSDQQQLQRQIDEEKQESGEDQIPVNTLTSAQISNVQRALFRTGFYAGAATGKWDPASTAALEDFQKSNNLISSGQLDKDTVTALGLNPIQFGMFSAHSSETTGQAPAGPSHTDRAPGK